VDAVQRYVAFAVPADPASGVEIRVNFGLLAGREATPAEIDELARRLLVTVERVSIVSERRHEISDQVEASVHQVSISVADEGVPPDVIEAARLEGKLVALAEAWARACSGDRRAVV
jgi:hypothetical protein